LPQYSKCKTLINTNSNQDNGSNVLIDRGGLVSVLVCSFNSSQTIIATLKSIFEQDYKDIQVIVVDDNSSDDSVLLAERFLLEAGSRVRGRSLVLVNSSRLGTVASIKRGLAVVEGAWVKPIGADDVLKPNYFSVLLSNMIQSDADIGISAFEEVDISGLPIETGKFNQKIIGPFLGMPKRFRLGLLAHRNILPAPTLLVKASVASELYSDIDEKLIEDWPFWLLAFEHDKTAIYLDHRLVEYRQHNQQATEIADENILAELKRDLIKIRLRAQKHEIKIARYLDTLVNCIAGRPRSSAHVRGSFLIAVLRVISCCALISVKIRIKIDRSMQRIGL